MSNELLTPEFIKGITGATIRVRMPNKFTSAKSLQDTKTEPELPSEFKTADEIMNITRGMC